MNDILHNLDPEENYIPDDAVADADLLAPPDPGDFMPTLVLPEAPVLKKLALPEVPLPGTLATENAAAMQAWRKSCAEIRHRTDAENRELLRAHSVACAEANAEYQRAKSEYDRYQSAKMRLEARIEQAKRDANAKAQRKAMQNLQRLERERKKAEEESRRAGREKERARRAQENRIAGIREQQRLRSEAKQVEEDKRKAWIEKIAAENRATTQEFGDPFAGLSPEQRKQRVLNAYFFADTFYIEAAEGFMELNATKFEEMLEIHAGKATTNPPGVRGLTAAKIARNSIETTRKIKGGVGHFAWVPPGVLPTHISGENRTVLNLSTHRFGRVAEKAAWGPDGGFPILSEALANGFGLHTKGEDFGQLQLDTFLSTLARAAKYYDAGNPRVSAGSILCGDPNSGKSWVVAQVKMVFGGLSADPWNYFQSGCRDWNDDLAESSIWVFKDPVVQTAAQQATTTAAMKQALSDQGFRVKTKFKGATEVERYQLLVGTMNRDAQSRSCMPTAEIADKINIFRLYSTLPQSTFDHLKEHPEYMLTEHAAFRRFLLDYQIPNHVKGGSRYGVKTFTHPEFRGSTLYEAEVADIGDLIVDLAARVTDTLWTGTATDFLRDLETVTGRKAIGWDNVKVGRGFTKVRDEHPDRVDKKKRNGTFVYHIFLDRYRGDSDAAAVVPVEESGGGMENRGGTEAGVPDSAAAITSLLSHGTQQKGGASCG